MAVRFGLAYVRRSVRHNSVRRGLLGGDRFWLSVFVLRRLAKASGKVTKRGEMPIRFTEKLKPGQGYVVSHFDPKGGGAAPPS